MDRVILTGAVIGFLAPVVVLSPLNKSEAWFAAWQKSAKPAEVTAPRQPDLARAPGVGGRHLVQVRHARAEKRIAARQSASKIPAPLPPVVEMLDPKEQLARTIDPGKRPDWYLIDPTLKRGDVLFLQDRVVVFRGRKIGDLADYVPVSRTRMLSRKERGLIEKLAGPASVGKPARALTAARPAKLADAAPIEVVAAN